jgi:hypothetical protein
MWQPLFPVILNDIFCGFLFIYYRNMLQLGVTSAAVLWIQIPDPHQIYICGISASK